MTLVVQSLCELAWGNLNYDQAIEKGEILTQSALKLSLTAAMFFSYRFALSMANPLLGLSLIAVNICIHPAANMNALFLITVSQFISLARQAYLHHSISYSLLDELLSKGVFPPGCRVQEMLSRGVFPPGLLPLYLEAHAKTQVAFAYAALWFGRTVVLTLISSVSKTYFRLNPIREDETQTKCPLEKARYYSLWLDRKIITASKAAAPRIASLFRYQQPAH